MQFKRSVDSTLLAELGKPEFYPVALVFIDFPGDPVRGHSGVGTLSWNGEDWLGLGAIGGIDVPPEVGGLPPEEATFSVIMAIGDALDAATTDALRGQTAQVWMGATTTPGGTTLIGTPEPIFSGFVIGSDEPDAFTLSPDGQSAVLRVRARAGQPARASASVVHSNEDQQSRFSGDTFFLRAAEGSQWRTNPPQWPAP